MSLFSSFTLVTVWTYRIPSLLLSTAGVLAIFLIVRKLFDKRVGYVAGFLFAIHGLVLEVTSGRVATDHFDLHFLAFVTFSVWFAIRANHVTRVNLIWSGFFLGCAILSKWLPALIVLPLYFIKRYESRSLLQLLQDMRIVLFVAALIALPWQLFSYINYPLETA